MNNYPAVSRDIRKLETPHKIPCKRAFHSEHAETTRPVPTTIIKSVNLEWAAGEEANFTINIFFCSTCTNNFTQRVSFHNHAPVIKCSYIRLFEESTVQLAELVGSVDELGY